MSRQVIRDLNGHHLYEIMTRTSGSDQIKDYRLVNGTFIGSVKIRPDGTWTTDERGAIIAEGDRPEVILGRHGFNGGMQSRGANYGSGGLRRDKRDPGYSNDLGSNAKIREDEQKSLREQRSEPQGSSWFSSNTSSEVNDLNSRIQELEKENEDLRSKLDRAYEASLHANNRTANAINNEALDVIKRFHMCVEEGNLDRAQECHNREYELRDEYRMVTHKTAEEVKSAFDKLNRIVESSLMPYKG